MNPATPNQKGREFESQVASLFRAAGYIVEENPGTPGQQIDIVATSIDNLGIGHKLLIECKYTSDAPVSNAVVQDFVTFTRPLLDKGYSRGVLVASRGFSQSAKLFASQYPFIDLRTYTDLEDSIFDFSRSFITQANAYQRDHGEEFYIELLAEKSFDQDLISPDKRPGKKVNLVKELIESFDAKGSPYIGYLLGDFGAGKTTAIDRVNHLMQTGYLKDRSSKLPFIFKLNRFADASTLSQYIESQIELSFRKSVTAEQFLNLCRGGRVVIFLDGFDEIATNASEAKRKSYLEALLPLFEAARYIILSSRPSYFKSVSEFQQLMNSISRRRFAFDDDAARPPLGPIRVSKGMRKQVGYSAIAYRATWEYLRDRILGTRKLKFLKRRSLVYSIAKLDKAQILDYIGSFANTLRNRFKIDPEDLYNILLKIYDISDLMTRPLLLKIIIEVILAGKVDLKDPNLSMGPAALYKLYINSHLAEDWKKGPSRHFLEKEERLIFARAMALAMLAGDGGLTVSYDQIMKEIEKTISMMSNDRKRELSNQMEEVCTDVRVCSFLRITKSNNFEFIHKSFMEYLVADHIQDELASGRQTQYLDLNLNHEILYFLGSFQLIDKNLRTIFDGLLAGAIGNGRRLRARNVAGAILYSGAVVEQLEVGHSVLDRLKFKNLTVRRLVGDTVIFDDIVVGRMTLELSRLKDGRFRNAIFDQIELVECEGEVAIERGQGGRVTVERSDRVGVRVRSSELGKLVINRARQVDIDDDVYVREVTVSNSKLTVAGNGTFDSIVDALSCKSVHLRSLAGKDGALSRSFGKISATRCSFENFHLTTEDTRNVTVSGCNGVLYICSRKDEAGIFGTQGHSDKEARGKEWLFKDRVLFVRYDRLKKYNNGRIGELWAELSKTGMSIQTVKQIGAELDRLLEKK